MTTTVRKTTESKNNNENNTFNLQEYLSSKDGDEWLADVKVHDANKQFFRYYAPPVAWEDIQRHDQSAFGDFIFDVTMRIKNTEQSNNKKNSKQKVCSFLQNKNPCTFKVFNPHYPCSETDKLQNNSIRYVLRPQNMTDPISLQSTKDINIPIGNYNGDKLKNVRLIDLLSKPNLLKDIGLNCKLSGSLYEPLLDEPPHCLPDIKCICGESMKRLSINDAYNGKNVYCDICNDKKPLNNIANVVYHCPNGKQAKVHQNGYDICQQCVGLQIRTFIETKQQKPVNKNNNNNSDTTDNQKDKDQDIKMNDNDNKSIANNNDKQDKTDKYGKGGMMFSVGCGLMSESDMGHSYEIEVYLHKSRKYRNGKCLCIITTSEGSTANIIEQGKISKLKFAKNKKECDWGIERFDTSTEEGRINERTGKSAETDMIIYFIPVQQDKPEHSMHIHPAYRRTSYRFNSNRVFRNGYLVGRMGSQLASQWASP